MNPAQILIVEDERALSLALAATVRQLGAIPMQAPTAALARDLIEASPARFAAMILDIGLPDENGLRFLASLREAVRPPAVVITAHGELENAISARKLGVREFFPKPLDFETFRTTLLRLIRETASQSDPAPVHPPAFVGAAPAMRPVFQQIAHACASREPVLIHGETGSGRSLVAELIHRNNSRGPAPFIQFRPDPMEPIRSFAPSLAAASGGTLVLDGVAGLHADCQAELMRQWEANDPAFPRILAISSPLLREAVEAGSFRSDLFYRLQVLEVRLPPLRDRIEDLPTLFSFFLAQLLPGRTVSVEEAAWPHLARYPWPGNLRELRNVASYVLTISGGSGIISPGHLPAYLLELSGSATSSAPARAIAQAVDAWLDTYPELPPYRELSQEWERLLLQRLLDRHDGKLARLANSMQANRSTLRKKLKE